MVYETHSLSVDNERGIATGWLPGRLSENGKRLATELGERRRADGIGVVFTSDLRRAVETAEIAFTGTAIPIRRDARLRECNFGTMNGTPASVSRTEDSLVSIGRIPAARAGVRRLIALEASFKSWRKRVTASGFS